MAANRLFRLPTCRRLRSSQRCPSRQALHSHSCCLEPLIDLACNGYAARRVGVNADGVRFNRQLGAVGGDNPVPNRDVNGLPSSMGWIVQQCARQCPFAQSAVWLVSAVSEGFGSESQSHGTPHFQNRRAGLADHHESRMDALDGATYGEGNLTVLVGCMIQRAVWLHMHEAHAQ